MAPQRSGAKPAAGDAPGNSLELLRITVLGSSGSGKTSLVSAFVNHFFPNVHTPTVGPDLYYKTLGVPIPRVRGSDKKEEDENLMPVLAEIEDTYASCLLATGNNQHHKHAVDKYHVQRDIESFMGDVCIHPNTPRSPSRSPSKARQNSNQSNLQRSPSKASSSAGSFSNKTSSKEYEGYLPFKFDGCQVLKEQPDGHYLVDNSQLKAPTKRLLFRTTKNTDDINTNDRGTEWGKQVTGRQETSRDGQRWLKVKAGLMSCCSTNLKKYAPLSVNRMGFIIVYDSTEQESMMEAFEIHSRLERQVQMNFDESLNPVILFLANKVDKDPLGPDVLNMRNKVKNYVEDQKIKTSNVKWAEVSAMEIRTVKRIFRDLLGDIRDRPALWQRQTNDVVLSPSELALQADRDEEEEKDYTSRLEAEQAAAAARGDAPPAGAKENCLVQ